MKKAMKELTSINIVCLGNWNRKIFTPSWVASNLFELEDNRIDAFFNPHELDVGFRLKDVIFLPRETTIEIKIEKIHEESKDMSGKLLNRLLVLLPHTPIKAIGVNLRYIFGKDEHFPLVHVLNEKGFDFNDYSLSQIKFSRNLEESRLNIITDIRDEEYVVNFNFHHDSSHFPEGFEFSDNVIFEKIETAQNIVENG